MERFLQIQASGKVLLHFHGRKRTHIRLFISHVCSLYFLKATQPAIFPSEYAVYNLPAGRAYLPGKVDNSSLKF